MADRQRVSCNMMKQDAEDLAEVIRELPQEIQNIQEAIERLAGCWEGPAWDTYQAQVKRDLEKIRDMYAFLVTLQEQLGVARDAYFRTEYDVYTDFKYLWI